MRFLILTNDTKLHNEIQKGKRIMMPKEKDTQFGKVISTLTT